MIKSEWTNADALDVGTRSMTEAREQDRTCEFCYYQWFDDKAYPCSRCVCNMPTECKFQPMIEKEAQQ